MYFSILLLLFISFVTNPYNPYTMFYFVSLQQYILYRNSFDSNIFLFICIFIYLCFLLVHIIIALYSVSDRVGLLLHNSSSPFLPVMDIFSVNLQLRHIRFHTLTMSFVFCLQLWPPYISLLGHNNFSSSHVHTMSAYHF